MKIPKVLLGAILAGITVQAISSCEKKTQDHISPATQQPGINGTQPGCYPGPDIDPCPACGMG